MKASEVDNDFFAKILLGVAQGVGKGSKGDCGGRERRNTTESERG